MAGRHGFIDPKRRPHKMTERNTKKRRKVIDANEEILRTHKAKVRKADKA